MKKFLRSSVSMLNVLSRSDTNYNRQSGLLPKLQSSSRKIRSGQSLVLHCASHADKVRKSSSKANSCDQKFLISFCAFPQILWTFTPRTSNIPINLSNFNNELKYVNVSVTKHDGIYNCSTESDFQVRRKIFSELTANSTYSQQEFDVAVVTPPKFLDPLKSKESSVAGTIKFNCSVSGNPLPKVDW